jgi:hypothetical protein
VVGKSEGCADGALELFRRVGADVNGSDLQGNQEDRRERGLTYVNEASGFQSRS